MINQHMEEALEAHEDAYLAARGFIAYGDKKTAETCRTSAKYWKGVWCYHATYQSAANGPSCDLIEWGLPYFTVGTTQYVVAIANIAPHGTCHLLNRTPIGKGWAIRLPSGMCHEFDDRASAEASQYWPRVGGRS